MMKNRYLILMLVCLFSCTEKVERVYYKDGKLHYENFTIKNNDSLVYTKEYYENGSIKEEFFLKKDSILDGRMKIYYRDGQLLWDGYMKNSAIQIEPYRQNWKWPNRKKYFQGMEVDGHPDSLFEGQTYHIRFLLPKIHPRFYIVCDGDFQDIRNPNDKDMYPYIFTPKHTGIFYFRIIFMNKDKLFIVGNPMITVGYSIYKRKIKYY